ncbi:6-phospho-3-hexuloisomerase [Algoriphagus sp. PAP.12]|uniref:6-phospho-3-hexuloisomerase n=1 Tax=Algoriphagus sp. PAP.12 TaxID=2996678 RepID=UPI00227B2F68|nr:6-phospho-3-hexuloisomerase [Algoriphagus sp. PAP.12]
MEATIKDTLVHQLNQASQSIAHEHERLRNQLDFSDLEGLISEIKSARRIFLIGMGRSGFMMKAAAMRLMHLGYQVHVVGETTSPAIESGDLLIAGSGSGTTKTIVNAAKTALSVGARVACFTTQTNSPLAELSDQIIKIEAAQKQEQQEEVSIQYAGSLFEQALLLTFDSIIQVMWKSMGSSADELWKRHSNLE